MECYLTLRRKEILTGPVTRMNREDLQAIWEKEVLFTSERSVEFCYGTRKRVLKRTVVMVAGGCEYTSGRHSAHILSLVRTACFPRANASIPRYVTRGRGRYHTGSLRPGVRARGDVPFSLR